MESIKKKKHTIYRPVHTGNAKTEKLFRLVRSKPQKTQTAPRKVGPRAHLVDTLNYIHFQGGTILAVFKHHKFNRCIRRNLRTKVCQGNRLDCTWANTAGVRQVLKAYSFQKLLVTDENNLYCVSPRVTSMDAHEISFSLPETYTEIGKRKIRRHAGVHIKAQMIQEGVIYEGNLTEFSPVTFKVTISEDDQYGFQGINPDATVNILLSSHEGTLYSGGCRILRQSGDISFRHYILEPVHHQIQRFQPGAYRSPRHRLVPSPGIAFRHPFTGEKVQRKVFNLSGSGFGVEESEESSLLLTGMVIPNLEVTFAGGCIIQCRAQVVYRKLAGKNQGENIVRCGLAIIDIQPFDHMKLLSIVSQVENNNTYIADKLDIEVSWKFFFANGLIRPDRYAALYQEKNKIRRTYKKLYNGNPDLARHFVYQTDNTIKGHMAMLRFYERAWLIHHEAAGSPIIEARLGVLNQVARFIHDSSRFASLRMDYVLHYFEQGNRFSSLVFKGGQEKIGDSGLCSLDSFVYFPFRQNSLFTGQLENPWKLTRTHSQDLVELENSYNASSRGLLLKALDLYPGMINSRNLAEEYRSIGLKRGKFLFSLQKSGNLKAIILINLSDVGLTISEMTNCIKIFVLDQEYLPQEVIAAVLSQILQKVKRPEMPVLLYPADDAIENEIPYEKRYYLWILNTRCADRFLQHLERLVKK